MYSGKQAGEGLKATFEGETKVTKERRKKLSEWDRMLKNFRYGDALDSVMRRDVTPATAFALMDELIRRDGLAIALANRTDVSLEPVLSFLVKHIIDPRYCVLAADVASVLIGAFARLAPPLRPVLTCPASTDIYTPTLGLSPLIDTLFTRLRRKLDDELDFHRELTMVQGALDMVFASSAQPRA